MFKKRFRLTACLFFILLGALMAASNYLIQDLGVLPGGFESGAKAINNLGEVVGISSTDIPYHGNFAQHAFLYDPLANPPMRDLGTLPGTSCSDCNSWALDINDLGQVVGRSDTGSTDVPGNHYYHAILYSAGLMEDLGTLGGNHSEAYGINNHGTVVGFSESEAGACAFYRYPGGDMKALPELLKAYAINDNDQVVGVTSGHQHAALYDLRTNTFTDLGTLAINHANASSEATGINNLGQIVGWSDTDIENDSELVVHAFLYDPLTKKMMDLGTLDSSNPDAESEAWDINDSGYVIGHSSTADGDHGFIYSVAAGMEDLGTLTGGPSSWAEGINNADPVQVVGWSYLPNNMPAHAVIWTLPHEEAKVVNIDIKPGSYPNTINLGSNGVTPVAILSSAIFDARTVDSATIKLSGAAVAVRGNGKYMASSEDVNGDGRLDLVVQVLTQNIDPKKFEDGFALLTGMTFDGIKILGKDKVTIVPAKK